MKDGPEVAANRRGDAIAVWSRGRGRGPTCCDHSRLLAAYRPAGARFGAPTVVLPFGDELRAFDVGIDANGNAVVAADVVDPATRHHKLEVAYRPHAGGFRAARTLAATQDVAQGFALAVSDSGESVVAWTQVGRAMASFGGVGGSFGAPVAVPQSQPSGRITAAMDAAGDAALLWTVLERSSPACCSRLVVARRPHGGAFGPGAPVSDPMDNEDLDRPPALEFDPAGGLLAAWGQRRQPSSLICCAELASRYAPSGSADFEPAKTIALPADPDGPRAFDITRIALDPQGQSRGLLYTQPSGPGPVSAGDPRKDRLYTTLGTPAGGFSTPASLPGGSLSGDLEPRPDGSAVVVWEQTLTVTCGREGCFPGEVRVEAAEAPPGGGFGQGSFVSTVGGREPHVAVTGAGDAIATWVDHEAATISTTGSAVAPSPTPSGRGPRISRLAVRPGPRTVFSFRISAAAPTIVYISRFSDTQEEGTPVARLDAKKGLNRVAIPRSVRGSRLHGVFYAFPVAEDRRGYDSPRIHPVRFRMR